MNLLQHEAVANGPPAIRTHDLAKRFGRQHALRGVDIMVPEGAVYVLVGPNGAGKTTTLRILLDLVRPTSGSAEVFGLDPARQGALARARIGYVPESHDIGYGWMRVRRLLDHHAAYFPGWDAAYARELTGALELREDARFGKLSKGQARRVQLVMALAHRPALLLLDEPTDGLDPVMRETVLGVLAEHISDSPTTMLVSTHLVHETERLADHVGVLRDGRLGAQLPREAVHRRLRRYRAQVPEGWSGVRDDGLRVIGREGDDREISWIVWGDQEEVSTRLRGAGATVRDVAPLTLQEAAVALLRMEIEP